MATIWRPPYRETTLSPAVASLHPDVILLDWSSTDRIALEQLEQLRAWTRAPVVVLSDNDEVGAMVDGFDHGAYDYMTKPCAISELAARLHAARLHAAPRRRTPRPPVDPVIDAASFSVDIGAQTVTRDGQRVALTATEWKLLEVLRTTCAYICTASGRSSSATRTTRGTS
ncbi:DNA-binding response regulator [Rhodococcus sp. WS4]|nr:DNA-binding response regulator [Rhodococcus sp. WS4]